MTTERAAELWGVDKREVQRYCQNLGEQIGAFKKDRRWYIPSNACPSYRVDRLIDFLEECCKHINDPAARFPCSQPEIDRMLSCSFSAECIECRDQNAPLSIDNLYITKKGWELLFPGKKSGGRKYMFEALNLESLISFSLVKVG